MRECVGRALRLAVVLGLVGAAAAQAQEPAPPPDSIAVEDPFGALPPLPDSLAIYGDTLAVGFVIPDGAPPPGAPQLSLSEAVRLALAQNPGFGAVLLEAERAANDVTLGNAGYLPMVDANASLSGSRSSGGRTGGFAGDSLVSSVSAFTSAGADVTVGYTIFDGFRRDAVYRRLQLEAEQFALSAEAQAEALAFAVTTAYLDVVREQALLAALAEAVRLSEDRLRIEQARVSIGAGAEIDAALALADLNADRAALLRQGLAVTQSRAALGGLLALREPTAVAVTDTLALGPPPPLAALATEAVAQNRRLQVLEVAEAVAEVSIREVRAAYWPTVRAQAGVGVTAFDRGLLPALSPTPGTDIGYGLTVTLPLFDGGERRRRVENARLRARQAALDVEDERAVLRAEVAQQVAAVEQYRQLATLEAQNRQIARQNVRVALAQLQLGFITPIDLRQVQVAFLNAESRFVDAVYQARRAEAELRFLAGGLLPPAGLD